MHCQQRLIAYFYAIWGTFTNGTWDEFFHSLREQSNGSNFAVKRGLDDIMVSDIRQLDEAGCAISMHCLVKQPCSGIGFVGLNGELDTGFDKSNSETELNLTMTLTDREFGTSGVQTCKERLEKLLFKEQEYGLYNTQDSQIPLLPLEQAEKKVLAPEPKQDRSYLQQRRSYPAPPSESDGSLDSRPETVDFSGLFGYLMSSISQRRAIREAFQTVKEWELNFRRPLKRLSLPTLPSSPTHAGRRLKHKPSSTTSPNLRTTCEKNFCKGYNLEKICSKHKIPDVELDTESVCQLCYPETNDALIKEHCQERARREVLVFRILCIVLGGFIAIAILLYALREICRPMKKRWQLFWKVQSRPTSSGISSRFSSIFSVESNPAFPPGRMFKSGVGGDDYDFEIPADTFTGSRGKLSRFGGFVREPRKRIQDVFDLEALQLRHPPKEDELVERIPVLPRAPNASIRMPASSRAPTRGSDTHETVAQESGGAAAIHTYQHTAEIPRHCVP